jgi:hypothetical protein
MRAARSLKVGLIAGVAGALVLAASATAIAATREDPGIVAMSANSGDDDPDKAGPTKKGSKEAKKQKPKVMSELSSWSYDMYSSTGPSETEQLENVRKTPRAAKGRFPDGRIELARDLLAGGRR